MKDYDQEDSKKAMNNVKIDSSWDDPEDSRLEIEQRELRRQTRRERVHQESSEQRELIKASNQAWKTAQQEISEQRQQRLHGQA